MPKTIKRQKIYGVFYTVNQGGTPNEILFGRGGTSGSNHTPRTGLHLTGGTKNGSPAQKHALVAKLKDEIGEEFGQAALDALSGHLDNQNYPIYRKEYSYTNRFGNRVEGYLNILFCEIDQNTAEACTHNVTDSTRPNYPEDSPFEEVVAVPVGNAINEIDDDNNWFSEAVDLLENAILDSMPSGWTSI